MFKIFTIMEPMTVKEYSEYRGHSVQYIYKMLRAELLPDGVTSKKVFGKSVILYVDREWLRKAKKNNSKIV